MHILFPHQHKSQEIRQYNKNFTGVKEQFIRLTSVQLHESDTRIDLFFNEGSVCNSKAVYDPCCEKKSPDYSSTDWRTTKNAMISTGI